ncbi:dTDP-4-dehydrorhamnose reductase [Thermoactinospora rubra]|uniref:dTDP-4-dehydrorhamnose reductase n=1 Tax=Thermoactinospora rubra TaxID=1088767 RepID=UPI000A0F8D7D|nr:dTDP-4-dehydrorhamnose reductase [Thermoactinospora rubra]
MTRWLIMGAGGMLATDLVARLEAEAPDEVVALARAALDVRDGAAVRRAVRDVKPDVVVNCAAWNLVDDAESREEEATAVNGHAVCLLAAACGEAGARLVHLSTDYVFAGEASSPYAEDAPTSPLNAYGRGKLAGERAVLEQLPLTGYVVRTAWLYGAHGRNFVRTMARLAEERDTVDVVDDQRGQPTWTADLAEQLLRLVRSEAPAGVYHGTNSGEATWYELAREVFARLGHDPSRVRPVPTAAFPRPARRPSYSVLGHARWAAAGLPPMRPWREALREFL